MGQQTLEIPNIPCPQLQFQQQATHMLDLKLEQLHQMVTVF